MRYLLHHSDATYDQTTKKWTFTLDRRISNPRSITIKKCVFTASTDDADDYPSVVYMRSDALHGNAKTKHTVELKSSDHENSSDVLAVLEETHTLGRYAMKEQGVTFPVHGHTHLRKIDIYFTDGTTVLHGKLSEAAEADDSTISTLPSSVLICWWSFDTLSTLLDDDGNAISGTVGDGIRTLQSRAPGATSTILTAASETMQYVKVGESYGLTSNTSAAMLDDVSFPNISTSGVESYMWVWRVPSVTTADVVLIGTYHLFQYLDTSNSSYVKLNYWTGSGGTFAEFDHEFEHGAYYYTHATVSNDGSGQALNIKFRNLAGTTVVEEDVTNGENQNLQTDSEWSLGHTARPSWWPTSSRDLNYGATMSNMIIMDDASSAQITAAENWLLAKYGERTPLDTDKDATFFTELEVKATNR